MMRAYALALGAGTQAFPVGFGEGIFGTGVLRTDLMMSAGWGINLAVAELLIRRVRQAPASGWQLRDEGEALTPAHEEDVRPLHRFPAQPRRADLSSQSRSHPFRGSS